MACTVASGPWDPTSRVSLRFEARGSQERAAERPQRRTSPPVAPGAGARTVRDRFETDTQTDMLLGEPKSAICVQRFDDSLNSAIHTTYRTWLRSSSMHEPRDPPLKVVRFLFCLSSSRDGGDGDRFRQSFRCEKKKHKSGLTGTRRRTKPPPPPVPFNGRADPLKVEYRFTV